MECIITFNYHPRFGNYPGCVTIECENKKTFDWFYRNGFYYWKQDGLTGAGVVWCNFNDRIVSEWP